MNPSLLDSVRAGLALPLILVAVLAGAIGFLAGRAVYDSRDPARLSAITTRGLPPTTPAPPAPGEEVTGTEGSEDGTSGSGTRARRSNCPTGCECAFPRGGIIIRCGGSNAAITTQSNTESTPRPVPQGPPPSMPDLPGMG